jgi:hypothetical protein
MNLDLENLSLEELYDILKEIEEVLLKRDITPAEKVFTFEIHSIVTLPAWAIWRDDTPANPTIDDVWKEILREGGDKVIEAWDLLDSEAISTLVEIKDRTAE